MLERTGMKELSNRTATFTDSVIRRMTRISNKYGAVNLSQGFPDFDPPAQLLDSLSTIATDPKPLYHQYSITWGSQAMREALAAKQEHFMGMPINPNENIVVTCGSTEAMMAAMMTVTNPGDKVVIFSPFYENYGADTILSGAEPIYVPLNPPTFDFDREVLEAAFRDNDPKAIVLCNPSNPCGKVFTREGLTFIADLCKKYDAYCITDEVYEHIVYTPCEHIYFASLPGMEKRTLSCSSLSKTYSMTGWRLGWLAAAAPVIAEIAKAHQYLVSSAVSFEMDAAARALTVDPTPMLKVYRARRERVLSALNAMGLDVVEPAGAFYTFPSIKQFGLTSEDFCIKAIKEANVALVPGNCFGTEGHIRLSYCVSDKDLDEGLRRLSTFLSTL